MEEYRVVIPDERVCTVSFVQQAMPGVAVINAALVEFEPKIVFRWHLSVWMELTDLIENGMPSQSQRDLIEPFGAFLGEHVAGPIIEKPNALFLARITWNASRELIYRVHDPEPANEALKSIVESHEHPCQFDYRIDDDPEWELAQWSLRSATESREPND